MRGTGIRSARDFIFEAKGFDELGFLLLRVLSVFCVEDNLVGGKLDFATHGGATVHGRARYVEVVE